MLSDYLTDWQFRIELFKRRNFRIEKIKRIFGLC